MKPHINGLVQEWRHSSVLAMQLPVPDTDQTYKGLTNDTPWRAIVSWPVLGQNIVFSPVYGITTNVMNADMSRNITSQASECMCGIMP